MKADYKKVIEMVRKGISDREIMRELGVNTKTSLKRMYYDALVEAGKIRGILTKREAERVATKKGP